MAVTTLSGCPATIGQGDTVIFTENFTDFPVATWTLNFVLQVPGSAPKTIAATTSGSNFLITLPATTTANFTPGENDFAEYATEIATSQRTTAKIGILQVIPDLTQTQALSSASTMLAQVDIAITQLTSGGFQSVSVNNVSYTRYDLASLIALRSRLQAEVIREEQAANALLGVGNSHIIVTRFSSNP